MTELAASNLVASTWQMLNAGHEEISWSDDGTRIVVANAERLAQNVLPRYFSHSQYASWVRALNAYDFKKTGAGRWSHPSFVRGHPELQQATLKQLRKHLETALAQESAQRSLNAAQLSKHALQTQVRLPRGALRNSDAMEAGTCPVRLGWFQ